VGDSGLPRLTRASETRRRARLLFKKEFTRYYRVLCSDSIADPTDSYSSLEAFLTAWQQDVSEPHSPDRLKQELSALLGEVAQDLTGGRSRTSSGDWRPESLAERFWECVEVVEERLWRRLVP